MKAKGSQFHGEYYERPGETDGSLHLHGGPEPTAEARAYDPYSEKPSGLYDPGELAYVDEREKGGHRQGSLFHPTDIAHRDYQTRVNHLSSVPMSDEHTRNSVERTVGRSTMPLSDINHLANQLPQGFRHDAELGRQDIGGNFDVIAGRINLATNAPNPHTVIHEIGHAMHIPRTRASTEASPRGAWPYDRPDPVEEGVADGYSDRHVGAGYGHRNRVNYYGMEEKNEGERAHYQHAREATFEHGVPGAYMNQLQMRRAYPDVDISVGNKRLVDRVDSNVEANYLSVNNRYDRTVQARNQGKLFE